MHHGKCFFMRLGRVMHPCKKFTKYSRDLRLYSAAAAESRFKKGKRLRANVGAFDADLHKHSLRKLKKSKCGSTNGKSTFENTKVEWILSTLPYGPGNSMLYWAAWQTRMQRQRNTLSMTNHPISRQGPNDPIPTLTWLRSECLR